ncbi:hypothetical protein EVAR_51467_1 [Eumeta japonica]|uniref:Histone-lysine N-methyltransferase SETMAR n=1 Tax=Eumeta variegata TaxID=151549 RepID=A0A4C1Z744_EUMVA|nr:hypothetical protein EVAR_51467_1 [Eumeta japonica]
MFKVSLRDEIPNELICRRTRLINISQIPSQLKSNGKATSLVELTTAEEESRPSGDRELDAAARANFALYYYNSRLPPASKAVTENGSQSANGMYGRTKRAKEAIDKLCRNNHKRRITLRHDNASSNATKQTNTFLNEKNVELMNNPAYSPDLPPSPVKSITIGPEQVKDEHTQSFPGAQNREALAVLDEALKTSRLPRDRPVKRRRGGRPAASQMSARARAAPAGRGRADAEKCQTMRERSEHPPPGRGSAFSAGERER